MLRLTLLVLYFIAAASPQSPQNRRQSAWDSLAPVPPPPIAGSSGAAPVEVSSTDAGAGYDPDGANAGAGYDPNGAK